VMKATFPAKRPSVVPMLPAFLVRPPAAGTVMR